MKSIREQHNQEGPPCAHMEQHLHRTADGTASWLVRLYAIAHSAHCRRCHRFLDRLKETLAHLRTDVPKPPQDAIDRLKNGAWREPPQE